MNAPDWLAEVPPAASAVGALAGVIFTGYKTLGWARRRVRQEQETQNVGRYDDAAGANKRLFDNMNLRIDELQRRCTECERGRAALLEHAVATQGWMLKVQFAAMAEGRRLPDPPLITPAMLDNELPPPGHAAE